MKLVKIQFSTELLEAILSAKNNTFVTTDCPDDVRVVKVIQDEDDQANNRVVLVLSSEEADWPEEVPYGEISMIDPFKYTVVDPDESPPTTEESSDG